LNYIDIHTHTFYQDPEVSLVLNAFPEEDEKLQLPVNLSIGLHPWYVYENSWENQIEKIKIAANYDKVIAIGEAGLDKTKNNSFDIQQLAFIAQLNIACLLKKPLIIHCVRSYSELLAYRKKSDQSLPWIIHWFNGDVQIARELIRKNCFLSFGHMLFNEQSKAFRVFKTLSPDHVLFETDNAGYTIKEVYARASDIWNMPLNDLKKHIIENFHHCFNKHLYGELAE
jgi:TatD DNase family protein